MHRLVLFLLLCCAPALAQAQTNRFSDNTLYEATVLSTAPLRVHYALQGIGRYAPADFPALRLDGSATLVFGYGPAEAQLHAPVVQVDAQQNYQWRFPQWSAGEAPADIVSVQATEGEEVVLDFRRGFGQPRLLRAGFIVEFAPGVVYEPNRVNILAVYLADPTAAPLIDVFTAAQE